METSKVLFEVRDCNQIPAIDSRDTSINYDYENFESFNRANDQSVSTKWLKLRELKIPARDEREKIDHRGSRGTRRSFPDLSQTAIIQLNADLSQRWAALKRNPRDIVRISFRSAREEEANSRQPRWKETRQFFFPNGTRDPSEGEDVNPECKTALWAIWQVERCGGSTDEPAEIKLSVSTRVNRWRIERVFKRVVTSNKSSLWDEVAVTQIRRSRALPVRWLPSTAPAIVTSDSAQLAARTPSLLFHLLAGLRPFSRNKHTLLLRGTTEVNLLVGRVRPERSFFNSLHAIVIYTYLRCRTLFAVLSLGTVEFLTGFDRWFREASLPLVDSCQLLKNTFLPSRAFVLESYRSLYGGIHELGNETVPRMFSRMFLWNLSLRVRFIIVYLQERVKYLEQWFLIFSKSGNTFDYMKNSRNTKINDPRNKQKHPA